MAIRTESEAAEYIEKVKNALVYLVELSKDAGLFSHTGIFMAVYASFCGGHNEIKCLGNHIEKYLEEATEREIKESGCEFGLPLTSEEE